MARQKETDPEFLTEKGNPVERVKERARAQRGMERGSWLLGEKLRDLRGVVGVAKATDRLCPDLRSPQHHWRVWSLLSQHPLCPALTLLPEHRLAGTFRPFLAWLPCSPSTPGQPCATGPSLGLVMRARS